MLSKRIQLFDWTSLPASLFHASIRRTFLKGSGELSTRFMDHVFQFCEKKSVSFPCARRKCMGTLLARAAYLLS